MTAMADSNNIPQYPYNFDPSQLSNKYSLFNGQPYPFPPTYDSGNSAGPTDAQGNPIQSYLNWKSANPAGMTLNNTPAQPQKQPDANANADSYADANSDLHADACDQADRERRR